MEEYRNVICGYMKRNVPVTRRFIQHALMRRGEIVIMVRDGRTNKILAGPDPRQLWIKRTKEGKIKDLRQKIDEWITDGPERCGTSFEERMED